MVRCCLVCVAAGRVVRPFAETRVYLDALDRCAHRMQLIEFPKIAQVKRP
jgi:hypothetical protein